MKAIFPALLSLGIAFFTMALAADKASGGGHQWMAPASAGHELGRAGRSATWRVFVDFVESHYFWFAMVLLGSYILDFNGVLGGLRLRYSGSFG